MAESKKARAENSFEFQAFDGKRDFAEYTRCICQSRDEFAAEQPTPEQREKAIYHMNLSMQKDMSSIDAVQKRFGSREHGEGFLIFARHANDLPNGPVAGCIGCIRSSPFEIELVRLFVDAKYRGYGLGKRLVQEVLDYADKEGYERVFLFCGSESGQGLYSGMGFHRAHDYFFWKPMPSSKRHIDKVVLIGATHGNELVGTHLVQEIYGRKFMLEDVTKGSYVVDVVLANPEATKKCVRFLDRDLNRCFATDELEDSKKMKESSEYETRRAAEINAKYGPKSRIRGSIEKWKRENPSSFDYMIDMHGTTTNMGICFMTLSGDALTMRMALRVKRAFEAHGNMPPFYLLVDSQCPRDVYNNIDGLTPSGVCIEAGPQSHGTLNDVKLVRGTHLAVVECLKEIREFNEKSKQPIIEETIEGFELWKTISFPKGSSGAPTTVSAALHPDVVGADFTKEFRKGDPLFVDLLTGETVAVYEEDEPAYACLIGEAAYFTSGVAMWLCKKKPFFVYG